MREEKLRQLAHYYKSPPPFAETALHGDLDNHGLADGGLRELLMGARIDQGKNAELDAAAIDGAHQGPPR